MNSDNLAIGFMTEKSFPIKDLETYVYTPTNGWAWLQRIAIWILRKLHCYETKIAYQRVEFCTSEFMNFLLKQRKEVLEHFHGAKEFRVLVGADDMERTLQLPYIRNIINFEVRVAGMNVTVVPWMKGILVLPEGI